MGRKARTRDGRTEESTKPLPPTPLTLRVAEVLSVLPVQFRYSFGGRRSASQKERGEPERRRDLIGLEGGRKGDCRGGAEPRNWRTAATLRRGGVGRTLAARPTSPLSFSRASNTHRRTPDSADATGNHRVERGWRFPPRRSAVRPASVRGAREDRTADHRVEGSGASLVSI